MRLSFFEAYGVSLIGLIKVLAVSASLTFRISVDVFRANFLAGLSFRVCWPARRQ